MRGFLGISFPLRFGLLALALLTFRPFAFTGSTNLALLLPEALVARTAFATAFHFLPELPAMVEHVTGRDLPGNGDCRIANVRALGGDGYLLIGLARNAGGQMMPHVWGESPQGDRVDVSCKTCRTVAVHAILAITDYSAAKVQVYKHVPGLDQNIRYLKMALTVEKVRALLGSTSPQPSDIDQAVAAVADSNNE